MTGTLQNQIVRVFGTTHVENNKGNFYNYLPWK